MDEEKLKLYYVIEHQAKMIKAQVKTIDTLTWGIWGMFAVFIVFALVNLSLSFYERITSACTKFWRELWSQEK